jgi:hypothetical protein
MQTEPDVNEAEVFNFSVTQPYITPDELTHRRMTSKDAFKDLVFLDGQGLPQPELTYSDKAEALNIFLEQPDAPAVPSSPGAARALEKLLKRFDYTLANSANKMRQYTLFKIFELAENEDPKIAIKAIEMLGKVSEIGLFTTRVEISTAEKTTGDLEIELNSLMSSYAINGSVGTTGETYDQITDAELSGGEEEEEESDETN